jgi:hypothetical protein
MPPARYFGAPGVTARTGDIVRRRSARLPANPRCESVWFMLTMATATLLAATAPASIEVANDQHSG